MPVKWAYKYHFSLIPSTSHLILSNFKGFANTVGKIFHLTGVFISHLPSFQQSWASLLVLVVACISRMSSLYKFFVHFPTLFVPQILAFCTLKQFLLYLYKIFFQVDQLVFKLWWGFKWYRKFRFLEYNLHRFFFHFFF